MYVEKRKVGGNEYFYLKMSSREGNKVRSKTIAYLGKATMKKKQVLDAIKKVPSSKIESAKRELRSNDVNTQFLSNDQLDTIKNISKEFSAKLKLPIKLQEDMFKDFKVFYIYNTNSIEGNTLTLKETNFLLNEDILPAGKDLKEVYDHINERIVFEYILKERPKITKDLIISLHSMLLKDIDKRTGSYRSHDVRVIGAEFTPSEARYVTVDMNLLLRWYDKSKKRLHPIILAALFHEKFERIHPFYDGNGRTGRVLVNLILLNNALPPIIIPHKKRLEYYDVLSRGHKASLTGEDINEYKPLVRFFYAQLLATYDKIFSKWG